MKRKGLKIALCLAVLIPLAVIGVYSYGLYQIFHFNSQMQYPEPADGSPIVEFRLDSLNRITTLHGQQVMVDMGSRHCFISPQTVDALQAMGYPISRSRCLIWTTDPNGRRRFYTSRVVMPMAFAAPERGDSVVIDGCELFVTPDDSGNLLGMDFLEKFAVEYDHDGHLLRLYSTAPSEYIPVLTLCSHDSRLGDVFGYSRRAYIPLAVNDNKRHNYYLDTGPAMDGLELVMPHDESIKAHSKLYLDPRTGLPTQAHCPVMLGNRMRLCKITFSDDLRADDYSINPFNAFDQDFVLDYPTHRLLFRPTASTPTASL